MVYWDSWIVSKSAKGPMNSSKNKLNSKKNWFFKHCQTHTKFVVEVKEKN